MRHGQPPKILPVVLAVAILGISTSGPLARLSGAAPLAIAAWRLGLTLVVVAVALTVTRSWREYRTLSRRDLAVALFTGTMLAFHFWAWIASVSLTTVAASVVLVNLHPIVIVTGSALWLRERPARQQVVGLIVAMLGGVVVALGDAGPGLRAEDALVGDLLAFIGALTVGVYYLVGRDLRQRLSLWTYVGLVYGACFLVVVSLASLSGQPLWPQPPRELLIFAGIAIGPMLLGHTGFNWSLRYVPAYVVSLAILAEPVGATLLAAFLPGISERPGAWTLIGGAIILGGLVLGTVVRKPRADIFEE
ncbi:MAG: DMT family transporter [Gemmatimonadaceae bacterium]